MTIKYNSNLMCGIDFSQSEYGEQIKSYFEWIIESLISNFASLPNLKECIITDNFIRDALDLQRELGHEYPSITNNEFGRAYGKVISDENASATYVLLDAGLSSYIIDDNCFDLMFRKNCDEERINFILQNRRMALNILYHELSHVEMQLKYTPSLKYGMDICCFTTNIANRLLQEYYACRRASEFYREDSPSANSHGGDIENMEKRIMSERRKFNLRNISLNDFLTRFNEFFPLILVYAVSHYANFYDCKQKQDPYVELKLEKHIQNISLILEDMISDVNAYKEPHFEKLNEEILNYIAEFEIHLEDTPDGIYWHIPYYRKY